MTTIASKEMKEIGFWAHMEIIQTGGDLGIHLMELSKNSTNQTMAVLSGAVSCLMLVYGCIERAGLVPKYEDDELNRFMHSGGDTMAAAFTQKFHISDEPWLSSRLSAMVSVVTAHRDKLNFISPVAAKRKPTAPPIPVEVRVVGMPDRVTETSVEYDADGNIKSSKQTEKDAAADQ